MGPFKKYVTCIIAFFTPLPLSHFVNFTLSLPLGYSLKTRNYRMRGKKIFAYMAASAYHVISREVENPIFRHN